MLVAWEGRRGGVPGGVTGVPVGVPSVTEGLLPGQETGAAP